MMRIQEKHALRVQVLKQTAKHARKVAERKLEKKALGYIFLYLLVCATVTLHQEGPISHF